MANKQEGLREGSLEAPERHALKWQEAAFYDEENLFTELERVFDICHGCRRCFSLCQAFPTLFDAIDDSETMELDGVPRKVYWEVVDHCYLCDLCFMTKCPYVPPHEWAVDFPHLMLRAKAVKFKQGNTKNRDKLLTSTDTIGKLASIPVVAQVVNASNRSEPIRDLMQKAIGVDAKAKLPEYHSRTLSKQLSGHAISSAAPVEAGPTRGKVALFGTCYGEYNKPDMGMDLVAVFEHNDIPVKLVDNTRCCGMPKLELGDLESVAAARDHNIPLLTALIDEGWDIVAPVPSCALMFKQELPLMFPNDPDVAKVRDAMYDPFEYLAIRHRHDLLKTDFRTPLGKIAYQVPCHLRVQNIGLKTRDILALVPDTEIEVIERCSGHDGTYAVKAEFHAAAVKIGRPVASRVGKAGADHFSSDCPMAGDHISHIGDDVGAPEHPLGLLRKAYGI